MNLLIADQKQFSEWSVLNDSIMGGMSQASCRVVPSGLLLEGNLIEKGGGFVSCKSPICSPPLDLSNYLGVKLCIYGQGETFKFSVSCLPETIGLITFSQKKIRWVASVPTNKNGITTIKIPFKSFEPALRSKPVSFPIDFDSSTIYQFQLLYSKFGQPGKINETFKSGLMSVIIKSIHAYS